MAEVLSPPMQPSTTITLLHTRPATADAFQTSQQYQPQRLNQPSRSMYNGSNHGFRTTSAPIQPYAFQATPHLRSDSRSASTPTLSTGQVGSHRPSASTSTMSSQSSSQPQLKDDITTTTSRTLLPTIDFSPQLPELSFTNFEPTAKSSPDRYRRPAQRRIDSTSGSNTARAPSPAQNDTSLDISGIREAPFQVRRQASFDDIAAAKKSSEFGKRYRGRSLNQFEGAAMATPPLQAVAGAPQPPAVTHVSHAVSSPTTLKPAFLDGPSESQVTNGAVITPKVDSNRGPDERAAATGVSRAEQRINPPPRQSSDANKRLAAPSPLSKQASELETPPSSPIATQLPRTYASVVAGSVPTLSPAAQQLAAVSDRDLNKGMKSRLRRAFSFGSAQELRRVSGEQGPQTSQQNQEQHQRQIDDELDAEQLEIARRQEAAGIGAGIYSGQGGFTGSTDNLSISSTASSASLMLRKMGRGAKKGARSIKGLFRPKSVIGVPAADGPLQMGSAAPVEASIGQVSMVTVEAERQNVNVNARPDERTGGGTGFPKLERNSLDAAAAAAAASGEARKSGDTSDSHSRRSVVGSDKDRAEVLAAVRKGILKRSATDSPTSSPVVRPAENGLPYVPQIVESPVSSMPSTPKDGPPNRSSSAPAVNDYFAARMHMAKSMPSTPNGTARSISFSPRIQFHDAWSSTDYDRRGEIATCNRLTPMLAQQIKEELNTFKMEMEVHELSKPHTHFF